MIGSKRSISTARYYQLLAFASPWFPITLLTASIGLWPSVFSKYYGVSLVEVGAALLVIRGFDGIADVLVGHFSDRYHLLHGTLKPFVISGGVLVIPCSCMLLFLTGIEATILGFLILSVVFYLAYTIFVIPYFSWSGELFPQDNERTLTFSLLTFFARNAALLFFIIPYLPVFKTREITPEILQFSVIVDVFMLIPTLIIFYKCTPNGNQYKHKRGEMKPHHAAFRDYYAGCLQADSIRGKT